MYGPTDIPSVGKVEFSWVANNSSSVSGTRDNSVSAPPLLQHQGYAAKKGDEIVHIGDNGTSHETDSMMLRKDAGGQHEVDYDVAEMDDAWA